MSETSRTPPSGPSARRAEKARRNPSSILRTRVGPSPELLAFVRENPGADLGFSPGTGATSGKAAESPLRAFSAEDDARADNLGCPHCQTDFSVAYPIGPRRTGESHDVNVSCPACGGPVIAALPASIAPDHVAVGPARQQSPVAAVLERALSLRRADSSLNVRHSETIATLELERDELRQRARTDPATGLLNERAHLEDREETPRGHVALHVSSVQAVYDSCGQESGNQYARDVARLIELAAGAQTRTYRLGTAKFALITRDFETAGPAAEAVRHAIRNAISSVSDAGGAEPGQEPASSLEEFLARHPKPYGLKVRMRRGRVGGEVR